MSMKIALMLTLSRVVLSPLFVFIYLYYEQIGMPFYALPIVLAFLLLICELTDLFDGMVARKFGQVTALGKILDPMADSIVRTTVFLTFTFGVVQLPLMLVLCFFYRDAMISTLRTLCALHGVTLAARPAGKLKAVIQAIASFIILFFMGLYGFGWVTLATLQSASFFTVLFAAIYTWLSAFEYFWAQRAHLLPSFMEKA